MRVSELISIAVREKKGKKRTGTIVGVNQGKQTLRVSLDPDENRQFAHVKFEDWAQGDWVPSG